MTSYVALLRGVNVGGNTLKMDWLRASCEELGLADVQTYLQSGNIVFSSPRAASRLIAVLKEKIDANTLRPVPIVLRSAAEMAAVVAANPFLKQRGIDVEKLHVTFLGETPGKPDSGRLDQLAGERDQYRLARREIYLYCPINYGETQLSNTAIEKVLAVTATTRNWKTVTTLLSMAST
jgi:uncharacterized protein (DUF1697 family)